LGKLFQIFPIPAFFSRDIKVRHGLDKWCADSPRTDQNQINSQKCKFLSHGNTQRLKGNLAGRIRLKQCGKFYAVATDLNNQLIAQQDSAVKYFVLNDPGFRELYYDVYRDYPEYIKQEIPVDTTVTVDGGTLTANQSGAEYRWLDCNLLMNPIRGATGVSYSPSDTGKYAVEITMDGFVVRSGCHEIKIPTGIRDKKPENTVKVYPNPVNDHLFIIPEKENAPFSAILFDISGKKIKTYTGLDPTSARIEINVPKGVYLLEVKLKERTEYFKLLKR